MSIFFNKSKAEFIDLTYVKLNAIDRTKQVFSYPSNFDMSSYALLYLYHDNKIQVLSPIAFRLIPNTNRIELSLKNFSGYMGLVIRALGDPDHNSGIDFIDKFGQAGTVYTYDNFDLTNSSGYSRLVNTTITSENLLLGFYNQYPVKFSHVTYNSGSPSPSITFTYTDINPNTLIAFFNSEYKGATTPGGYITGFTNSKAGAVEIVSKGVLEFSLSESGPWVSVLTIPTVASRATVRVYIRCGQVVTALVRLLNSVKIITTEAV